MKLTKQDKIQILENALAYLVAFGMIIYGAGKVIQFDGALSNHKVVAQLSGMELMWAFYSYSKAYVIVLGVLEIGAALLILFIKTRLIGGLIASTILINIILQDIFYHVNTGALRAAILYQSSIFLIFYIHKNTVKKCLNVLTIDIKIYSNKEIWMIKVLLSVLVFVIFRILEFYLTTKF
ncbi:hypothetical protein [Pedobacter alpinus]|uniref:DoxX family protein n=1 Tax=Pedobacter alpinus TaxID=1590643 RepID=A0ABW5TWB1_9SPHI